MRQKTSWGLDWKLTPFFVYCMNSNFKEPLMRWAYVQGVKLAITVETGFIISAYLILSTYSTAGFLYSN